MESVDFIEDFHDDVLFLIYGEFNFSAERELCLL